MNRKRWFYLGLLLLYAGILIGIQFHTHTAGTDQLTAHCKSCQVSQTPYDTPQSRELPVAQAVPSAIGPFAPAIVSYELLEVSHGRAPPLS